MDPKAACLDALKRIVRNYNSNMEKLNRFDINFYALRKDGVYAGASLWSGRLRRTGGIRFGIQSGAGSSHRRGLGQRAALRAGRRCRLGQTIAVGSRGGRWLRWKLGLRLCLGGAILWLAGGLWLDACSGPRFRAAPRDEILQGAHLGPTAGDADGDDVPHLVPGHGPVVAVQGLAHVGVQGDLADTAKQFFESWIAG